MKKYFFLNALLTIVLSGCINVNSTNKTIKAEGPDTTGILNTDKVVEIDAMQAITVNYTVGESVSVKYTVPESIAPYLDLTCIDGKLRCKYRNGVNVSMKGRKTIVEVVAPAVGDFEASSAAIININGNLSLNKLDLEASSAANINIEAVSASDADIESSSAALIIIKNLTSNDANLEASSSSKIDISGIVDKVDAEATSAGSISLAGTYSYLNAEASSSAKIYAANATIATGVLDASSGAFITVPQAKDIPYKTEKGSGGSIIFK